MTWNRRKRFATVLFALVNLLFMQLAVAGYICPGSEQKIAEASAMSEAGMPCAEAMPLNMDDQQPNLCQAHCQAGHQSADKHELSSPVAISALPANFRLQIDLPVLSEAPLQAPHLQRTTVPPVAIRNCCFRL